MIDNMGQEPSKPCKTAPVDADSPKDAEGARTSIDSGFRAVVLGESAGYSQRSSSASVGKSSSTTSSGTIRQLSCDEK